MSAQLARALFDNEAESPEELSFCRGDLLRLLAPGPAGWHLCSLHGRRGLVPANRVRLLPGPEPPGAQSRGRAGQMEEEQEVYVVPPPARPCPTPPDEIYKVPRRRDPGEVYDTPSSLPREAPPGDTYDTPPPFPQALAAAPPGEEGEEEEEGGGREEGPAGGEPVYASPSNLRRASALLNLYESPEELLWREYELPGGPGPGGLEPGGRPRLPSPESLSRRPLPALPAPGPPRRESIQDRPLPPPPPRLGALAGGAAGGPNEYEGVRLAEEYDYVHLSGTDRLQPPATDRDPPEAARGPGQRPEAETPLSLAEEVPAGPEEAPLLRFYGAQCRAHATALLAATEALGASAGAPQPPGVLGAQGRALVVTAHKLLFLGDTLARRAPSAPLRARLGAAGGALGQALKGAVLELKGAARGGPGQPPAPHGRPPAPPAPGRALPPG